MKDFCTILSSYGYWLSFIHHSQEKLNISLTRKTVAFPLSSSLGKKSCQTIWRICFLNESSYLDSEIIMTPLYHNKHYLKSGWSKIFEKILLSENENIYLKFLPSNK